MEKPENYQDVLDQLSEDMTTAAMTPEQLVHHLRRHRTKRRTQALGVGIVIAAMTSALAWALIYVVKS